MSKKRVQFTNRELSWLDFNERVLELSNEDRIPLLERLKFISIFSNNLDEFFMIRVAGIVDQIYLGYTDKDRSNLSPTEVLDSIRKRVKNLIKKQKRYFYRIKKELKKHNIIIVDDNRKCDSEYCNMIFEKYILPSISPITLGLTTPFPFIYNKRSVIVVEMKREDRKYVALIIIPENLKKLYVLHEKGVDYVFMLERIIISRLNVLFKDFSIENHYVIRVTRNADLSIEEEESEDLLKLIEHELDKRRKGQIVRIEINKTPSKIIEKMLKDNLNINEDDIYVTSDFIDLTSFFDFKSDNKTLYFDEFCGFIDKDIPLDESIFDYIKKNEILTYRPYSDFSLVSNLVKIAANDKKTLSIKMTVYRASKHSSIIKSLIKAAENKKTVSVVIELKARFDEEMNVEWARQLENAGCIVTYGMPGLKIHAKNLLITRSENGGIVNYSHISTGNYNEDTAKVYTDLDYITAREDIGFDSVNLFNYLMGYTDYANWNRFTLAPKYLRNKILMLIDNEINIAKKGRFARLIIKVNSLIDKEIIKKLYEASKFGVKIDLIVRGMCGIKAQIKNLSENIRVVSIVGRFLEHPRIFYFFADSKELMFISSADFMERNMDRRVENMVEISNPHLKKKLFNLLEMNLKDDVNAWELVKSKYKKIQNKKGIDSQSYYMKHKF